MAMTPAEWLEMRKGRGLGEARLPGMLELPLPTESFQWRQLPEPNSVDVSGSPPMPEEIHFPDEPAGGRIPILPPQALTLVCTVTYTAHLRCYSAGFLRHQACDPLEDEGAAHG